jgi:hypothetical protein
MFEVSLPKKQHKQDDEKDSKGYELFKIGNIIRCAFDAVWSVRPEIISAWILQAGTPIAVSPAPWIIGHHLSYEICPTPAIWIAGIMHKSIKPFSSGWIPTGIGEIRSESLFKLRYLYSCDSLFAGSKVIDFKWSSRQQDRQGHSTQQNFIMYFHSFVLPSVLSMC